MEDEEFKQTNCDFKSIYLEMKFNTSLTRTTISFHQSNDLVVHRSIEKHVLLGLSIYFEVFVPITRFQHL